MEDETTMGTAMSMISFPRTSTASISRHEQQQERTNRGYKQGKAILEINLDFDRTILDLNYHHEARLGLFRLATKSYKVKAG